MKMYRVLLITGILVIVGGCQPSLDLKTALQSHWEAAQIAQIEAAAHWDQLIIQGFASCQRGLSVLSPFESSQADQFPASIPIRDHLNLAIDYLRQSSDLWDQLCGVNRPDVTPAEANQGYLAVQNAQAELNLAQALLDSWQP